MKTLPKISIVIPTYNEEKDIGKCLQKIFSQDYPKNKLEVFLVDNYSTDNTVKIAKKYQVKVILNSYKDAQASKMLAFAQATGELFIYLDSDTFLMRKDWFKKMCVPLMEDKSVVGSFTKYIVYKTDNPLLRFLSYDELQRDPIYEFFSPSVYSTIKEDRKNYYLCEYELGKIPPAGLCLFRKKMLDAVWNPQKDKKYMELDSLVRLVNKGYKKFAFLPDIGIYHPFVTKLSHVLAKRLRNIKKNYLHQDTPREYTWFSFKNLTDQTKIVIWIIYATTLIGPTLRGLYKSLKHKDFACMYEPIVSFTETWVIIWGFVRYSLFRYKVN